MTAEEAYDDCIALAKQAETRQRNHMVEATSPIARIQHEAAALTFKHFAVMLIEVKKLRCPHEN